MPDWLISAVIQYPIVVVIGFVAWYAYRELKRNTKEFRDYERNQHAEKIQKLEAANKLRIESKNEEIKRLKDDILGKIQELADAVAEMKRKPK